MSSERNLMQEVWRLAGQQPEGVTIPSATPASAARLRFSLYNAVKGFRNGKGSPDEKLRQAIENCSIRLEGCNVVIQTKLESDSAKTMLALVGGVVKSVEERAMEESSDRLTAMLQRLEAPTSPATPAPTTDPSTNAPQSATYGARNHAPRLS